MSANSRMTLAALDHALARTSVADILRDTLAEAQHASTVLHRV